MACVRKKLGLAISFLAISLLFVSCNPIRKNTGNAADIAYANELAFDVQYAFTPVMAYAEEYMEPKVVLIDTKQQLDDYYQNNNKSFVFDKIGSEYQRVGFVSFKDAIAKYDDMWFVSKQLLLIITTQPNLCTLFMVNKVIGHPKNQVDISVIDGMAAAFQTSHIIIELNKEFNDDDLFDVQIAIQR